MPVNPPVIDPLPDTPSRTNRPTFSPRMDAFLASLPTLRLQIMAVATNAFNNATEALASSMQAAQQASASAASATLAQSQVALASAQATAAAASASSALAAPATTATSATSLTPGTGVRALVTQAGKAFAAGQALTIVSAADPRQWMVGAVVSYAGTALSVNVTAFGQSPSAGAAADWVIAFWGALPPAAKTGQVLRLRGATPEWGDVGGEPIVIRSALNLHPQSTEILSPANGETALNATAIGPRGSRTASIFTSGASASWSVVSVLGFAAGQRVTYERSARAVTGNTTIRINVYFVGDLTDSWVDVDLSTGRVIDLQTNNTRGVSPTVRVTPEGDGWYRIALILTTHVAGHIGFYVTIFPNSTLHVADASVTAGAGPALYVDVPSTTPVAGAGARRRNLLSHSLSADSALGAVSLISATKIGNTLSPLGDLSATVYSVDASSGGLAIYPTLEGGVQYTFSVWVRVFAGPAMPSAGALHDTTGDGSADVLVGMQLLNVADGWRRATVTFTQVATGVVALYPALGVAGNRAAFWGMQLERGPIASNLIVTGGAPVDGQHADLQPRRVHNVDTTHAPVNLAPPSDMQPGDWFEVVDIGGNAAANPITVMRGPYSAIDGDASDFEIDVPRWGGRFTYDIEKGLVIS